MEGELTSHTHSIPFHTLLQVVLTHGRSEVVMGVLKRASDTKNFTVMVTEGRPEGSGAHTWLLLLVLLACLWFIFLLIFSLLSLPT